MAGCFIPAICICWKATFKHVLVKGNGWNHLPVLLRRKPRIFLKYFREITLIFEPCCKSNINDGMIGIGKKTLAFFYADHVQIFFKGRTGGLLEQCGKIRRIQVHMVGNLLQRQIMRKILGNITDGLFGDLVAFAWNVIKHAFRKNVDGFLKLVAQIIQSPDVLKFHEELIVDSQDTVTCGTALDSGAGKERGKLHRPGFYDF